jgi:hypothetical protein
MMCEEAAAAVVAAVAELLAFVILCLVTTSCV